MKIVGIVAEYNPFHNGHESLISSAKASGYTHTVAVMSGNFVQRSSPAIAEKRVRTRAALFGGIDLVLELPLPYATATAKSFSAGALATLKATGCVDGICFGSEAGSTVIMKQIAEALELPEFPPLLNQFLSEGITFAKARSLAIAELLGEEEAAVSREPNNLLGIEYISAAKKLCWDVDFLTLPRFSVGHHSRVPEDRFASASFLRENPIDWEVLEKYVPKTALNVYREAEKNGLYPADWSKVELGVLSQLRRLSTAEIALLPDISEGIENRFFQSIHQSSSLCELTSMLKTKRYPLSRIRRLILSGFLQPKASQPLESPPYIRVLGSTRKGKEILSLMKSTATLPFSHSLAVLEATGAEAKEFANLEAISTDQYALCLPRILPCGYDYECPAVFL